LARKYTKQLVEHKQEWLNTNQKEDVVIEATLAAIQKAHGKNANEVPLPGNIAEVSNNISFLPSFNDTFTISF
jgi:hypothetical protein